MGTSTSGSRVARSGDGTGFENEAAAISRLLGATDLTDAEALGTAVASCLQRVGERAGIEVAFALLLDDQERVTHEWHWIRSGVSADAPGVGTPLQQLFGSAIAFLRMGQPVAVEDLDALELASTERAWADRNGVHAILVVPVVAGAELIGVVGLLTGSGPRHWSEPEIDQMGILSELLVRSISRTNERVALAVATARARRIAEYVPEGLLLTDLDGVVTWTSPWLDRLTAGAAAGWVGRPLAGFVHGDDRADLAADLADPVARRHTSGRPVRIPAADGWRWMELSWRIASDPEPGVPDELVVSLRDVHEHRMEVERLTAASERDALTGLLNRGGFERALAEIDRSDRDLVVAFCDLDDFRLVNNRHGHAAGDAILQAVALALTRSVRDEDLAARYGGDEFVLALPGLDPAAAALLGERIVTTVHEDTRRLTGGPVTISVGLAVADPDAELGALRARADAAMYLAKDSGRGRWVLA